MFCPECGAQIPDGSKFCSQCGRTLKTPQKIREKSGDSLTL